ncbi:class I SAM-dependent methyltransferase [Pseudonocardia sp.]|uniref:class I SAM-dependent methyltransferase n=1 Tax=Pseudonocardia sp. TaxID=60912 RepID=UPI00260985ED|nr:class I SAM-dependent methyltransferase [Pseudonocardia sp.]
MTQTTPTHGHGHGHEYGQDGRVAMADILDLDAEVLAEHTASIVSWLPVGDGPRRIVDLGCGTGVGTFALLARFPEAHVTAVDSSDEHLRRVQDKAREAGVAGRVDTVRADLDAAWPDLGRLDLVWASASLHHMADPDRLLRRVRDTLTPGGLLVVVEPDGFPRFLPDHAPEERPGLEGRCHDVADRGAAERLPHRGADFGPMLVAAGFEIAGERIVTATVEHTRSRSVGRYALTGLGRIRDAVADTLAAEDLAALDRLLDPDGPHGLLRRDDLALRTTRTVWAARA